MTQPSFIRPIREDSAIETFVVSKAHRTKLDPKGFFVIKIEQKKILVGFCDYQRVMHKKFIGEHAEAIYQEILNHGIISSLEHAAYLGRELTKAEYAIKYHLDYVQE